MNDIILIGNGGHSKVMQAIIERSKKYNLIGILDQNVTEYKIYNQYFLDNTSNFEKYKTHAKFLIAIGDNYRREKIIKDLHLKDDYFTSLIDDTAILADNIKIDVGTVVMPGVVINPDSVIGKHSIINTGAIVEHDNNIGNYVHVSPGATLSGTVTVDDYVHIGAGATVIPNTKVSKNSVVGAGAVVIKDLKENCLAVGVPAKIVKEFE